MNMNNGKIIYKVEEGWGKLPKDWRLTQVAGVATDKDDNVFVFNRGQHPVIIFDEDGNLLTSWGEGAFKRAHSIYIGKDEHVYCVDEGNHTIRKFTLDGKLLLTLGTVDKTGDEGEPFNRPTDIAISSTGMIYISDGYGNNRVHKFSSRGELLFSWGKEGNRPGEFNLPHGIWADRVSSTLLNLHG
jgi:DNA-binding beta-propeller fold protein YncE